MYLYAIALTLSAFLLFLVQPIIGKFILPWYGGAPAVWTTCMLFFQAGLLGGYAYSHFLASRLKPRTQVLVHFVLLTAALCVLPITPSESWKPQGDADPTLSIVLLLGFSIGLPYFVLSSTGPLLQSWLGITHPGRSPYWLYALSNAGSFLALLSYPFAFEVNTGRLAQTRGWSYGFALWVLICGFCAWRLYKSPHSLTHTAATKPELEATPADAERVSSAWDRLLWVLLSACSSAMLLATTNKICQDMAVTPFLWVLPLALYLLTFILCFAGESWYPRIIFGPALLAAAGACVWVLHEGVSAPISSQVLIFGSALFVVCMVCHGELFRLRPRASKLTGYYLAISFGGALGGLCVAIVAPLIFTGYYEFAWSLGLCLFLFAWLCLIKRDSMGQLAWGLFASGLMIVALAGLALSTEFFISSNQDSTVAETSASWLNVVAEALHPHRWAYAAGLGLLLLALLWGLLKPRLVVWHMLASTLLYGAFTLISCLLLKDALRGRSDMVEQSRNFYGCLAVFDYDRNSPESRYYLLRHGQITHGLQFVSGKKMLTPTTYYTERSGVALALETVASASSGRKVGLVGLGTGTLAAYAETGDDWRVYEINPQVVRLAKERFSYIPLSQAPVQIVLGDARLSLEREASQQFDVLALDAFSSDSIPLHLLTKEAFAVYLGHMKPKGIIAVHISNRYLDLAPVLVKLQEHYKLSSATISHFSHPDNDWDYGSSWVLLAKDPSALADSALQEQAEEVHKDLINIPLWTDDYTSILPLLK